MIHSLHRKRFENYLVPQSLTNSNRNQPLTHTSMYTTIKYVRTHSHHSDHLHSTICDVKDHVDCEERKSPRPTVIWVFPFICNSIEANEALQPIPQVLGEFRRWNWWISKFGYGKCQWYANQELICSCPAGKREVY